jgi:hypothetical protein
MPLLASCLVLALISGTLLTLFSAGQADVPGLPSRGARPAVTGKAAARPQSTGPAAAGHAKGGTPAGHAPASKTSAGQLVTGSSAAGGTAAEVGHIGGPLPDKTLVIAGKATRLRTLQPAVLALVPVGCQCTNAMRDLADEAAEARVALYFVGTGAALSQLGKLAAKTGHGAVRVAEDVHNVLGTTYRHAGLTAILVHADGSVGRVVPGLRPGLYLTKAFVQLLSSRPAGS